MVKKLILIFCNVYFNSVGKNDEIRRIGGFVKNFQDFLQSQKSDDDVLIFNQGFFFSISVARFGEMESIWRFLAFPWRQKFCSATGDFFAILGVLEFH